MAPISLEHRHLHYPRNDDLRGICMLLGVTTDDELKARLANLSDEELRGISHFFRSARDNLLDQLHALTDLMTTVDETELSGDRPFANCGWLLRNLTTQADAAVTLANMAENIVILREGAVERAAA